MQNIFKLRNGEPCSHKGCLSHISHPCEGCGRIAGKFDINKMITDDINDNIARFMGYPEKWIRYGDETF